MKQSRAKGARMATAITDGAALMLLLGAGLAFYAGVCHPLSAMAIQCQRRSAELERLLASAQPVWRAQAALRKELAELKERAKAVHSRIPPHAEEAELLGEISKLADKSRLAILDYRRGGVTSAPTHQELRIGLRGEGPYDAICRFIHGLDRLERLCAVESMDIRNEAQADRYPVDLSLVFHFGMRPDAMGSAVQ